MKAGESEIQITATQNDSNTFSESDKQWLQSIVKAEIKNERNQTGNPKIQKVPWLFREIEANKKCYDPLVVSIGPYHHGKIQLQLMEKLKVTMARQFVNGDPQMLEEVYKKVLRVAEEARKCYSEGSTDKFTDKEFAQMMFLDGCFILQFIDRKSEDSKMTNHVAAFAQRDLFLLENQIPFLVLKELMSFKLKEDTWKDTFSRFLAQIHALPPQKRFFRTVTTGATLACQEIDFKNKPHLLEVFRAQLIGKLQTTDEDSQTSNDWCSYRSAKELKEVGVHFRPSDTQQFRDVHFKSMFFTGILKLPPVMIDDFTKSMFLNMVAYEACPDGPADFGVSSYVCFMDSLIDHAEDVKELRSKGILLNFLGSDQQVADLFNEIADNLVPNPYTYAKVKERIESHYKNRIKIWLAEWLHTHFTSPWTVLAFAGAIFALVLSVIQTYVAIYPPSNDSSE